MLKSSFLNFSGTFHKKWPSMNQNGNILVIGGKGGVGKTSISAIFVKLLAEAKENLLLIDADPAVSVTYAVGEKPLRTIGDLRENLIDDPYENREFRKIPIKTAIRNLLIRSQKGFDVLTMGRAEGKGCFCGINEMLRFGIESLCGDYRTTLIDCEAGIEQLNRRAVHRINKLILITDTSLRGMETVAQIRDIALKCYVETAPGIHLLVNRVRNDPEKQLSLIAAEKFNFEISGFIPEDMDILTYNARGITLIELSNNSLATNAVKGFLNNIMKG
jgi:CO dehydrogenase maturation factor